MCNFVVAWVVPGNNGACLSRFFIKLLCILVMCMRVFLSPECLCCAACSASLGPLVFHGSRREPLTTNVTFFCQLASFCLWCHIWYLVGCVQKVSW